MRSSQARDNNLLQNLRPNENTREVTRSLQNETLSVLSRLFPRYSRVAMLDLPGYMNVGDHLIWQGERHYLDQLHCDLVYSASIETYDPESLVSSHPDIIAFQGGGNFGDLWPRFQKFRESVVTTHAKYKIVQFPQTFWFNDTHLSEQSRKVFSTLPDYTLLLRDERSISLANEMFRGVSTVECPDMAFGAARATPEIYRGDSRNTLFLFRRDKEQADANLLKSSLFLGTEQGFSHSVMDWGDPKWRSWIWAASRLPMRLKHKHIIGFRNSRFSQLLHAEENRASEILVAQASGLFGRYGIVVSDRLHAQILASILGVPSISIENSYGKLAPIFEKYVCRYPGAHFALTADDAMSAYQELLVSLQ